MACRIVRLEGPGYGPAMNRGMFRNLTVLLICQALGMSCLSLSMTIAALVGDMLAPDPSLATVPLSLQFVGTMIATIPASLFMGRHGRRLGFSLGAILGVAAGGVCAWAVFAGSFYLFSAGSLCLGFFAAHIAYYRFAAADAANVAFRSRAVSWVLAGGLVAAFLGPELAKHTRDLFEPILFAGGYLAIACLAFSSLLLLQFLNIPAPRPEERQNRGRPLREVARQPGLVIAIFCAMVGYGAMNLVMVSTPLAMVACAHPFEAAAMVIQWHVVGMYAPSFFTGNLIHRFGAFSVIAAGALLIIACVIVNLSGIDVTQFFSGLILLGLGWNFMYVGGTTLLTECYRTEEKAKVQALNDFLVFGTTVVTAFSSGFLFNNFGWSAVNLGVLLPVALALAAVIWLARQRRKLTKSESRAQNAVPGHGA